MYYLIATANITARMRGYANNMFGGNSLHMAAKWKIISLFYIYCSIIQINFFRCFYLFNLIFEYFSNIYQVRGNSLKAHILSV